MAIIMTSWSELLQSLTPRQLQVPLSACSDDLPGIALITPCSPLSLGSFIFAFVDWRTLVEFTLLGPAMLFSRSGRWY